MWPFKKKVVGCIGKCTTGLTTKELDRITDNIHETLIHPQGRKIFETFLEKKHLKDQIECLKLYEQCSAIIENRTNSSKSERELKLESLMEDVRQVKKMAEDLSQLFDLDLLERINEALENPSKISLLDVLEETRERCRDYLSDIHKEFKSYASQPCPNN